MGRGEKGKREGGGVQPWGRCDLSQHTARSRVKQAATNRSTPSALSGKKLRANQESSKREDTIQQQPKTRTSRGSPPLLL